MTLITKNLESLFLVHDLWEQNPAAYILRPRKAFGDATEVGDSSAIGAVRIRVSRLCISSSQNLKISIAENFDMWNKCEYS